MFLYFPSQPICLPLPPEANIIMSFDGYYINYICMYKNSTVYIYGTHMKHMH